MDQAATLIATIRDELAAAAEALIAAAEQGLAQAARARAGDGRALDELEATLCAILEACAFQDLIGQRLTRLEGLSLGLAPPLDPLLAGPAARGEGLDQAAADRLLSDGPGKS